MTLAEIAEHANVSIGTVDRVIHNRKGVSEKTKAEILAIAEDPNGGIDDQVIENEARMCEAEITRRNKMASLRSAVTGFPTAASMRLT